MRKFITNNFVTSKFNFIKYINYPYKATICISFDFETSAQSAKPVLRAKVKNYFFNITNNIGLTNKDLSGGYGRGYGNRIGAEKILQLFKKYDLKATWFCTGHVLMKGNEKGDAYRINQKLTYALPEAGFTNAVSWRRNRASFYHEPFNNYKKYPYYYLGDIAEVIKQEGHDIQCHSFSHHYISMEFPENIETDLEDWQKLAENNKFGKSIIFAFPFQGDYHLIERTTGLKTVPAFCKNGKDYEISFLSEHVLKIFKEAGFELFTRCGSMHNLNLINGFIPYMNSDIYCMKDAGLFSYKDKSSFIRFLEIIISSNATIDFWLHPNDIIEKNKYELFKFFIETLIKYRDKGKINLCTILEHWQKFKREVLMKA